MSKDRHIAVTGSSGYLGKKFIELARAHFNVLEISHQEHTNTPENSNKRYLDLAKSSVDKAREALTHQGAPVEAIVHLGGLTSVPDSYSTPALFETVNATGTRKLMEATALLGIEHVVFASSVTVHGAHPHNPITAATPLNPQSPYALSKAKAEGYLTAGAAGGLGTAVSIIRLTNLAGKYPGASGGGVVAHLAREVAGGNQLRINHGYNTPDRTAERDILNVADAAELFLQALMNPPERGHVAVYPAGSGRSVSIQRIAEMLTSMNRTPLDIEYSQRRASDPDSIQVDISSTRANLHWEPRLSLEQTLASELEYARGGASRQV